jgi:hypothetical protein
MQRPAAVRINAHAIAVQAVCAQCVAFEHPHSDSSADQAVCQRESAGPSADHENAW